MARRARSLWGMPGGSGIASAIEPAGGVSPLRGGAEIPWTMNYLPAWFLTIGNL
jgi:hypothetical protein